MMGNVAWRFIEISNTCIEFGLVYLFFSRMLIAKRERDERILIWYILAVLFQSIENAFFSGTYSNLCATIIPTLILAVLFYRDSIYKKVFTTLIFVIIIYTSDNVSIILYRLVTGNDASRLTQYGVDRVAAMISIVFTAFWMIILVTKFVKRKMTEIKASQWVHMIAIPLISMLIVDILMNKSIESNLDAEALILMAAVFGGVLYINLAFFSHFESYEKDTQLNTMKGMLLREEENYKLLAGVYEEMRIMRHDFRNQLDVVSSLIGNECPEEAREYMRRLSGNVLGYEVVYTGNPSVDSMINMKMSYAKEHRITFRTKIKLENELNVDEVELCRILGNTLDNAMEACARLKNQEPFVELIISEVDGKLVLSVNNAALPQDEEMRTSKNDGRMHGLGLVSIRNSVQRMGGLMSCAYRDGIFTFSMVVKPGLGSANMSQM